MGLLRAPSAGPAPLPWAVPPAFLPFWVAAVGGQWYRVHLRLIGDAAPLLATTPSPRAAAAAALAGVLARLAAWALEAGWYAALWRAFGRRLPCWRFASWLVSISLVDLVADALARGPAAGRGAGPLWPFLLGPAAGAGARGAPATGFGLAFGPLGALTGLRILWTATMQARSLGIRPWAPLGATALSWAVGRLALAALADLARGRSAP